MVSSCKNMDTQIERQSSLLLGIVNLTQNKSNKCSQNHEEEQKDSREPAGIIKYLVDSAESRDQDRVEKEKIIQ